MKRFLIVAALAPLLAFAAPERTPIKWVHVPDMDITPSIEAYVDVNSRGLVDTAIGPLQGASILYVQKNNSKVSSMARYYLADCKTAVFVKIADFYFTVEKPEANSKPLYTKKYKDDEPGELDKTKPLYKTICPAYI